MKKILISLFLTVFSLMPCEEIKKPKAGMFVVTNTLANNSLSYTIPLIEFFLDDTIKVIILMFELSHNNFNNASAVGLAKSIFTLKALYKKTVIAYAEDSLYDSAYVVAASADFIMVAPLCELGHLGYYEIYLDKSKKFAEEGLKEKPIKAGMYKYHKDPNFQFTEDDLNMLQQRVDECWKITIDELIRLRPSLGLHKEKWINGDVFIARSSTTIDSSLIDKIGDKIDLKNFALQLLNESVAEEFQQQENFLILRNPYPVRDCLINPENDKKMIIISVSDQLKWQHSNYYLEQLLYAFEDRKALGIILYINCAGANTASMLYNLFTQIKKLKQAYGKLIVAYIDSVAFSGGYWLACCADFIIASPASSIGSIGVRFSKTDCTEKDLKNLQIYHIISANQFAAMFNEHSPSSENSERLWQELVDEHHAGFIEQVKDARPKCRNNERDWKEAQIFTGHGALNLGLIDAVGCLIDAIQHISKDIKLEGIHFVFKKLTKD